MTQIVMRFFPSIGVVFLSLCSLLLAPAAQAIQFELGGSFSTVIVRISAENPDNGGDDAKAVIANQLGFVPYFSLVGDETYFSDTTNFGWTYQIWGSSFEVDTQEIDDKFDGDKLNTSLKGTYFYALPLIYYRFGDRLSTKPVRNWRITLGIGYGVSYTKIQGDVLIATKKTEIENAELKKVNATGFYYSVGILLKASWKKFFFSISNNSPQVKDSEYIYRVHNVSYTFGYEFAIDFELDDYF